MTKVIKKPRYMMFDDDIICFVIDGQSYAVGKSHPRREEILCRLQDPSENFTDEECLKLINFHHELARELTIISTHVGRLPMGLSYRGKPLNQNLLRLILAEAKKKNPQYSPYLKFLDNLKANPSVKAREALYSWMNGFLNESDAESFPITRDGKMVWYRNLRRKPRTKELNHDLTGDILVDGEPLNRGVEVYPGSVIRKGPTLNELLAGQSQKFTESYASVYRIEINPKDFTRFDHAAGVVYANVFQIGEAVADFFDSPMETGIWTGWNDSEMDRWSELGLSTGDAELFEESGVTFEQALRRKGKL